MKTSKTSRAIFLCAIGLALTFPAVAAEKQASIATGPAGGVYLPLGKGMADVLGKYMPDTIFTHEATSASADNIRMVAAGKATMAFTQADTAWDGYKGYNKFEAALPIRTLAVIYPNHLHLVTRGSGVVKVSDLKGKRVSTGAAGSGTEIWGLRLLEANLINPDKDIVRHKLALKESITALQEGKIDAFLWASGTPAKAIADYAKEPGANVRVIDTAGAVRSMQRKYGPVYTDGRMPPNTYAGQTRTVRVAEVWNLLVVHEKADDKFVYDMLKTLFDKKAELVAVHEQAGNMSLGNQSAGESPIPYHPAAKKFFTDRGVRMLGR
jgi:uncharacterized protein